MPLGQRGVTVHIESFRVEGRDVNLNMAGNVTYSGSLATTKVDLHADIEKLGRATSSEKMLGNLFLFLKFALAGDEPPIGVDIRGRGRDTKVTKTAFKRDAV